MIRTLKYTLFALFVMATVVASAQQRTTRQQYIEQYRQIAIIERDLYGIPASITMAQGLLESDNGNSRLATLANNHFGIKCKKDWTGETILHDDDAKQECFRKYACAQDSYRNHSEFLTTRTHYASLFKLSPTDYQGWAHGLKAAGYATAPDYALSLIKIIEDNQLYLLDAPEELVAQENLHDAINGEQPVQVDLSQWNSDQEKIDPDNFTVSLRSENGYPVYNNNGSEYVIARQGDSYLSLSQRFGVSVKRLYSINDLPDTAVLAAGDMVYLRPKANKAHNGKLIHVVEQGETMHSVAQRYGIRLRSLANMNMRAATSTLHEGQQLRLK